MSQHDLISSYIDSELTADQEQEFLISLAASEQLRRSFRSELVLKNVLHKDETLTAPPRAIRSAIFGAVGLSAADAVPTNVSPSLPVAAAVQTASRFSTLFVSVGMTVAALVGFTTHALLESPSTQRDQHSQPAVVTLEHLPATTITIEEPTKEIQEVHGSSVKKTVASANHSAKSRTSSAANAHATGSNPSVTNAGSNDATIDNPIINRK